MLNTSRLTVAAVALLAIAGCHGSHGYDLTLGPFLVLEDAGPTFATISWNYEGFWENPVLLELWRWEEGDHRFYKLVALAPDETRYTDPTLVDGIEYDYRLYAYFEKGPKKDSVDLEVHAEDRAAPDPAKLAPAAALPAPGEVPWFSVLPGEPRVSPDGTRLAWAEEGRLFLLDIASGATAPLAAGLSGPVTGAAFLPDGGSLVVSAGPAGREDLWLVGLAGGGAVPLTMGGAGDREPDVSPDGARVVFARAGGLWVVALRGGEAQPLAGGPGGKPRWAPEGGGIAFLRAGAAGFDVLLLGSEDRALASVASGRGPLVWSPDGRQVWYRALAGRARTAETKGW